MQKVLSSDLWKTVRAQARKARRRSAAIAYVTQDLVGFRKGDTLIVDASAHAVSSGETDAKVLSKLHKKGVSLFHCAGLHAKVLLLDDIAVISSGNMSKSSNNLLVEAGVMTDHPSTVAGVASFIEQLLPQSSELKGNRIATLCKIKVVRRGGRGTGKKQKAKVGRLGNRTWLVGVRQLVKDPSPEEQRLIERATKKLRPRIADSDEEPNWIRWGGKGRLGRECREGDSLIQIWRSNKATRPSMVIRTTPVLLKQATTTWTRFYLKQPTGLDAALSWAKFKQLLKEVGYSRRAGPGSVHLLDADVADAIARKWKALTK